MPPAAPAPTPQATRHIHKAIPGTQFVVDAFRHISPGTSAFFLSHGHADHYGGLTDTWSAGPIYCSEVTARFVVHALGVRPSYLHPLPMDTPVMIHGVEVTLVDANHCPGAAQFLFQLQDGRKYIHCGDMRYAPHLKSDPHLQRFVGADAVFLDTTYCNKRHTFPPQEESIAYVVAAVKRLLAGQAGEAEPDAPDGPEHADDSAAAPGADAPAPKTPAGPRRVILISTYGIGKERILSAVAATTGLRLAVTEKKLAVMRCLNLPGLDVDGIFTSDFSSTPLHVTPWGFIGESWPFFRPNWTNLEEYQRSQGVDEVVGFVPTGWTYDMARKVFPVRRKGGCSIHLVPYSEHSSYLELLEYVEFLRPHQVIPTVGVEGESGKQAMRKMQAQFRHLVDETKDKEKFLAVFTKRKRQEEAPKEEAEHSRSDIGQLPLAPPVVLAATDVPPVSTPGDAQTAKAEAENPAGPPLKSETQDIKEASVLLPTATQTICGGETTHVAMDSDVTALPMLAVKPEPVADHQRPGASEPAPVSDAEAGVDEVQAIIGTDVPASTILQLLNASRGDVQAAVNGYFDALSAPGLKREAQNVKHAPVALGASKSRRPGKQGRRGGAPTSGTSKASAAGAAQQSSITAFFGASPARAMPVLDLTERAELEVNRPASPEAVEGADVKEPAPPQRRLIVPSPTRGEPVPADSLPITLSEGHVNGDQDPAPVADAEPQAAPGAKAEESSKKAPDMAPSGLSSARDAMAVLPENYDPKLHACWSAGEPTPYLHLARAFEAAEATTKRLRVGDILTNMFRSVLALSPDDLVATAYLATGKVAPDYEGLELSVGGGTVGAAIREAMGVSRQRLHQLYSQLGDLGDVAQSCRATQSMLRRPDPLTVPGVFRALHDMAAHRGTGAGGRRQHAVLSLLRACREGEVRYVVRTLVQGLRVGASWRSVIPALARAVLMHVEGTPRLPRARLDAAAAAATAAFHVCPSLDLLCAAMRSHPVEELERHVGLVAGVPIKPMLAKISEGVADAIAQLKGASFLAELKYDGMRSQIHVLLGGEVKVFSRNCEDRSSAFPDVGELMKEAVDPAALPLILDAEVVAVDRADGNRLRAFQELATRARVDVSAAAVQVDVAVFAFDCLMAAGQSLMRSPLTERRKLLAQALSGAAPGRVELARCYEGAEGAGADPSADPPSTGTVVPATTAEEERAAALQAALLEAFAQGGEGLMLKSLGAGYEPSKRADHWIKLKRDYCEGLHDTLDLVVIGAWHGSGRKVGWCSPFLMAVWDPDTEQLQSLCRCMSGFSDAFYREATERLKATEIPGPKAYYDTSESPDMWFEPREVWEIRGADLSLSPVSVMEEL
ncbi:LIG6 [Auxenochlorella protothecoides x Auxenochlorella symbiontica]